MFVQSIVAYLLEHPFPDVNFGEGMLCGRQTLMDGKAIVFDDNVMVWHYHHYDDLKKLEARHKAQYTTVFKTFGIMPQKQIFFIFV